jgi:hypothetical protein
VALPHPPSHVRRGGGRALRGLLARAAGAPTSLDLLEEIYRVTPEDRRVLVDQWWKQVVHYDLRVESAAYERLADGRYRVTARVAAAKTALDDGEERPLPMDEELDVAVFSRHPSAGGRDAVLWAGRLRVDGAAEVSAVVAEEPRYVAVDPFLRRIDRNRADNVREVVRAGRAGGPE